jgi:serine phosphatase RsbU (regulator of sigma subunit)/anti-sigma regulatory factor (Ser/Thr protein kinase)
MNEKNKTDSVETPMDIAVLFVDDEKNVLNSLERSLLREPYRKFFASSAQEARCILEANPIHVIVSDMKMPEIDGLHFLNEVKEKYPKIVRIILSGVSEFRTIIDAINMDEIYRYVSKPLNEPRELKLTLRQAIEYYMLRERSAALMADLEKSNIELNRWKDRISEDLDIAGSVQKKIFRPDPFFSGTCEMHSFHKPVMSIGGDLFNIVRMKDGKICVYIGDVTGHGVAAALISFLVNAIISDAVESFSEYGPAMICNEISERYLSAVSKDFYVTLFIGIFDPADYSWQCMNCGHPPPIMVDAQGQFKMDEAGGGVPIGMGFMKKTTYSREDETKMTTPPGCSLVFYTDGLIESVNRVSGEMCGISELASISAGILCSPKCTIPAPAIIRTLCDKGFYCDNDDLTIITARFFSDDYFAVNELLKPDLDEISAFGGKLENILADNNWEEEPACAIRLICLEHLSNIVRHGRLQNDSEISFRMRLTPEDAVIVVTDCGREWSFTDKNPKRYARMAEGGFGLSIINEICKYFHFFRRENRNYAHFIISKEYSHDAGLDQTENADEGGNTK